MAYRKRPRCPSSWESWAFRPSSAASPAGAAAFAAAAAAAEETGKKQAVPASAAGHCPGTIPCLALVYHVVVAALSTPRMVA